MEALQERVERIVERLKPWSWLWPPMAFAAGLGSFFRLFDVGCGIRPLSWARI
ncbi:DUF5924 family protein [Halomonas sp. Ps84H-12]|uniref:DUF5924 family protein n=1 Tax=Halomonas sp. Ps84H-12 TaxID=2954501 RepID=UPI00209821C5|nr:DUF5924 family protein [Halomonas sp. Ps84H-12]MCO7243427.1 DUF5924 family protein [Halomonas sp. Ps84H-12]